MLLVFQRLKDSLQFGQAAGTERPNTWTDPNQAPARDGAGLPNSTKETTISINELFCTPPPPILQLPSRRRQRGLTPDNFAARRSIHLSNKPVMLASLELPMKTTLQLRRSCVTSPAPSPARYHLTSRRP